MNLLSLFVLLTVSCAVRSLKVINSSPRFRFALSATTISSTPATTFLNCVKQAVVGAQKCIENGDKLIEVEFPPLPLEILEDSSSSARAIADANTRWALEFAQGFTKTLGPVTILYPDDPELQDAIRYVDMEGGSEPFPMVRMATHRTDSIKNAGSLDQIIMSIFGATGKLH